MRLDIHEVTVVFGGIHAVEEVSLSAEPGQVTGLIGPNGAGKTTIFNVICGYETPHAGVVRLDGQDVTSLGPVAKSRRGLARTFQRLELFDLLTVRENVQVAAESSRRRSDVDRVDVDEVLQRVGLLAMADRRADELPTGQARLLEVGRALATSPSVLLLDEPAAGLDEGESTTFAALVRSIADAGTTVLLVEHDMPLVMQVCDRIHVLDLGQLIASGSPESIRTDPAVVAAYLGAAT